MQQNLILTQGDILSLLASEKNKLCTYKDQNKHINKIQTSALSYLFLLQNYTWCQLHTTAQADSVTQLLPHKATAPVPTCTNQVTLYPLQLSYLQSLLQHVMRQCQEPQVGKPGQEKWFQCFTESYSNLYWKNLLRSRPTVN